MLFKPYIPSNNIKQTYEGMYGVSGLKFYYLPNVGRYNSFELKFHNDYNWLISACIELKKYEHAQLPGTKLYDLYQKILQVQLININLENLWIAISDYCLQVKMQKQIELTKNEQGTTNNKS
jgi:hypothetical protein